VVLGRSFETPVSTCHGLMCQLFNDLQLYGWRGLCRMGWAV